jgi:hypothetical protein
VADPAIEAEYCGLIAVLEQFIKMGEQLKTHHGLRRLESRHPTNVWKLAD